MFMGNLSTSVCFTHERWDRIAFQDIDIKVDGSNPCIGYVFDQILVGQNRNDLAVDCGQFRFICSFEVGSSSL